MLKIKYVIFSLECLVKAIQVALFFVSCFFVEPSTIFASLAAELSMPPLSLFKQSALAQAVQAAFTRTERSRALSASLCLGLLALSLLPSARSHANSDARLPSSNYRTLLGDVVLPKLNAVLQPEVSNQKSLKAPQDDKIRQMVQTAETEQAASAVAEQQQTQALPDSTVLLQQQTQQLQQQQQNQPQPNQQPIGDIANFKALTFDELEKQPVPTVDQNLVNQIYQAAEQAQNQAQISIAQSNLRPSNYVTSATVADTQSINQAPVNVDSLMQSIQQDRDIKVGENLQGQVVPNVGAKDAAAPNTPKQPLWKRITGRFKPTLDSSAAKVPRISVDVVGAPKDLATNIDAKLSTYTQEAFEDFAASLPQLRLLANQAAQALGYYNAEFKLSKVNDAKVRVEVTPNLPVKIKSQQIDFTGAGENQPQFKIIPLIPEQDVGDNFNHGLYEQTKLRIASAALDNGYFDAYWRLHDVKVSLPDNTADINLKYETGERYQLGAVEFRMSDPTKPLPLDMDILNSLAPWQAGDDYAFWRVNTLANNLTNTRYFNSTMVDTVRPDPISKPLELAPDLQALANQEQVQQQQAIAQNQADATSSKEVRQNVVDESKFAGNKGSNSEDANLKTLRAEQVDKANETDVLQAKARREKMIPVVVTLNADRLNSLETGLGFGTDTGVRLRTQYRRSIVNKRGHAFEANVELSQIRQSLDARYSIPYHHPLNDYLNLVTGYERETRDDIGPNVNLMTESLILGGERVIKNPIGDWQHTFGVRYRLDRLKQKGVTDQNLLPDAFRVLGTQQESLLLGYETSKTDADNPINPTQGFKQSYKIDLGTDQLLSDANMAIVSAGLSGIYSLGKNKDHQFLGRANGAYIFTNQFEKVPYNLRYFTGGDQSIRGFDYKSLSPEVAGFKIGGQALAVGSVEYNYQFKEGWRAALFSDFGNAYDEKFSNPTAYSAGFGLRWKSPIGPIRVDVASGISDPNHPIRLHFFIGPQL